MPSTHYRAIYCLAGPTISVVKSPITEELATQVDCVEDPNLNSLLNQGWELIEIVKHHSIDKDRTSIAYVIGKPT